MAVDRRERRRQQLLVAARAVFADKGYPGATVDDIVARVPVARGTFYLYFEDKLDVFRALVDAFFERLTECIESIDVEDPERLPRAQLEANLRRVVRLALEEPAMVKIALSDATGMDRALDAQLNLFYEALQTYMDESLEIGQAIGLVREGDRRIMLAVALGGFKELLLGAVTGAMDRTEEEIVKAMVAFLEHGLLADI